jgi:3-deoxy-D-arabino-heptulosonate 7-phosphate (DAHP) synthase class II
MGILLAKLLVVFRLEGGFVAYWNEAALFSQLVRQISSCLDFESGLIQRMTMPRRRKTEIYCSFRVYLRAGTTAEACHCPRGLVV